MGSEMCIRDSLPDGCTAREYGDKVQRLVNDHLPHLERKLEGEALGKFLIRLMPRANASEGRDLIRRLLAVQNWATNAWSFASA